MSSVDGIHYNFPFTVKRFFFIIVDSPNVNAEREESDGDDDEVRGFSSFNFIASTNSTDDFKFKGRN
jgi:hypothetical protein